VYVWFGLCTLLVPPSPKVQLHDVIGELPGADWSVNCTANGLTPLWGDPLKLAVGSTKTPI